MKPRTRLVPRMQLPRRLMAGLAVAAGLALLADAGWIHAKAALAQVLIEQAWQTNRAQGAATSRPWQWADTMPVARMEFVRQHESMVVLAGDSGRVLAFGPGHRTGTALPGASGNSVISAHRDTHFKVLREVGTGDLIRVEAIDGQTRVYQVAGRRIVDHRDLAVIEQRGIDELTLVTCWPFDALVPNGPERLVVTATRIDGPQAGGRVRLRTEAPKRAGDAFTPTRGTTG